nr:hybrid signal transduction histidine kinase M [Tanacetum cinerariifolium]
MILSKTFQVWLVVEDPQTAKEAWDLIALIFNDNNRTLSIALKGELRSLKLGYLSIDAYFHKIEYIAIILTSLGSPISNHDVVTISLEGLPDKYENFFDIVVHWDPFLDFKTVRSMLNTKEIRLKSRAQASSIDSTSSSPLVLLLMEVIVPDLLMLLRKSMTHDQMMALIQMQQVLLAKFGYNGTYGIGQSLSTPTMLNSNGNTVLVALRTSLS